jgi:hypothetical protein
MAVLNIMTGGNKFKSLKTNLDIFRWAGLGKTGQDIYELLINNPGGLDVKTISVNCNPQIHPATIYRKIPNLERCGLITVEKTGKARTKRVILRAVPGADLVKAARIIGTAGTLRRQIERHDRERRAYKAYIDRIKN